MQQKTPASPQLRVYLYIFQTMRSFTIGALFILLPVVLSAAVSQDTLPFCQSPTVVSETFIGQDKNVKVQTLQCANPLASREDKLEKRQTDVCGAECDTNCFTPSGGGPDPNECAVIADAILFDSQAIGDLFTIPANNSVVDLTFRSCNTFFVNQAGIDLQYCRTDWSVLVNFLAQNCQAQQNAQGGNCVASNHQWFIQVDHS